MKSSQEYKNQLFDLTEQIIQSMTELVKQFGKRRVDDMDILGLFLPIEGFEFPLIAKYGTDQTPQKILITDLWLSNDELALMSNNYEAIYFPYERYDFEPMYRSLDLPSSCSDFWPCKMSVEQMLIALKQAENSAKEMPSQNNAKLQK